MKSDEFHADQADDPYSAATFGTPAWAPLLPASIVALGGGDRPIERLLTLQSVIAKAVHCVTLLGRLRPRLHLSGPLTVRFR